MEQVKYAGFWKRFLAYLIDGFILGIFSFFVFIPILGLLGIGLTTAALEHRDPDAAYGFIVLAFSAYFMAIMIVTIAGWLYFALMESSSKGATLGKMALQIKVTDLNGNRISFARASGRYFGKIISGMIFCIGYMMAGFTEKKQAIHDMMANCLVIND
jgi:uncharacterized RDD family membrane protein YckC